MIATLTRVEFSPEGTRGILVLDGKFIAMTLECPSVSKLEENKCIPCGDYVAVPSNSPSKGKVYKVLGPRPVQIYKGIALDDRTEGKILLGSKFTLGSMQLAGSSIAFERFMDVAAGHTIHLHITESLCIRIN